MRIDSGHAHADNIYEPTNMTHYEALKRNVQTVVALNEDVPEYSGGPVIYSLNVHLPYEIQHPDAYPNLKDGLEFIQYGESLKQQLGVPLYWENAPELVYGTWELAHGQTEWWFVPHTIDLTLDVGHLMIGSKDIPEARTRIEEILYERGKQIKHLHVHENDLVHDEHWTIGKVVTPTNVDVLTAGRTFIYEQGENINGPTPRTGDWRIE